MTQQTAYPIPATTIALPGAFAIYLQGSGAAQGEGYYGDERDHAATMLQDAFHNAERKRCGKHSSYLVTVTDAIALVILAEYAAMSIECCEYGDADPTERRASATVIERVLATGFVTGDGFHFQPHPDFDAGAVEALAVLQDTEPTQRADFIEYELSDEGRRIGREISEQSLAFNVGWERALEQARPDGTPTRLYRGQGQEHPLEHELSTKGRYFTNSYSYAECYADGNNGDVFYVDVEPSELPPPIPCGRGIFEYLVSREVADRKQVLPTESTFYPLDDGTTFCWHQITMTDAQISEARAAKGEDA